MYGQEEDKTLSKSGERVRRISEKVIAILVIVIAVVLVCIFLLLSVIKLVKSTNKDIVAKLSMKTKVKDIESETCLEIKASDENKKQ